VPGDDTIVEPDDHLMEIGSCPAWMFAQRYDHVTYRFGRVTAAIDANDCAIMAEPTGGRREFVSAPDLGRNRGEGARRTRAG